MDAVVPIIMKSAAGAAFLFFALGLFNVHWLTRIRILLSISAGCVILGAIGWPLIRPIDPAGAVTLFTGEVSIIDGIICVALAFAAGLVACILSYPKGRITAPLAAPAGIALWAQMGGDLRTLLLTNSSLEQRQQIYSFFRLESLFWLILAAAGYAGMLVAERFICGQKTLLTEDTPKTTKKDTTNMVFQAIIAVVATVVIAYYAINIFAQDVKQPDTELGFVIGQPGMRQMAFAVFMAFGIAAFAAKRLLNVNYTIIALSSFALALYALTFSAKTEVLEHMVQTWSPAYFSESIIALLPVQLVSFAVIGAITGYWSSQKMFQNPEETRQ